MGEGNGDWLRVRGIGRERFAGHLAEYLTTLGYAVERSESTDPAESRVAGRLTLSQSPLPSPMRLPIHRAPEALEKPEHHPVLRLSRRRPAQDATEQED